MSRFLAGALVAIAAGFPIRAEGQEIPVDAALLAEVFPAAGRFGPKEGVPPVYRAYVTDPATGREALAGFVFLTSDLPPEENGYNASIDVLVGMDLNGDITGARVVDYQESLRATRGDFLRNGSFEQQFSGKGLTDPFRVRRDVTNVSGATITVAAVARGIRNAARRVAVAYLLPPEPLGTADLERLSWLELEARGIGDRLQGLQQGLMRIELFLVPLRDEAMGRLLMGEAYDRAAQRLGQGAVAGPLWMIGLDGSLAEYFRANALSIVQGADTVRFTAADIALTGEPRSGKVAEQFLNVGLISMDPSVDPARPFLWRLEIYPGLPPYTATHPGRQTSTPSATGAAPDGATGQPAPGGGGETAPLGSEPTASESSATGAPGDAAPLISSGEVNFADEEAETVLERTLSQTDWRRFALVAFVLVLATVAFFAKRTALRWLALAATLLILGLGSVPAASRFGGGGFLSVSHITSGIKVGPAVYFSDLPLLLLVSFTVITTLLWGRVFCGYLCPFGALQDLLEHAVPKRIRRRFPHPAHERGLYVKYGVLAVVVVPGVAGGRGDVFQYFEPFGTVFFLSPSLLLWAIAITILVASAIIPRFYCRYVCPLGAFLAIASILSPFRIRRVPHCTMCTVCEHECPTGAIRREQIDFKECVRCNRCEVNLIERAGVCRHDLDKVTQLVQLRGGTHRHRQTRLAVPPMTQRKSTVENRVVSEPRIPNPGF